MAAAANDNGDAAAAAWGAGASPRDQGEEVAAEAPIDFLKDVPREMTVARRLALGLMRFGWYYKPRALPHADGEGEDEAVGTSMVFAGGVGQLSPTATEAYPFSHSRRETPQPRKGVGLYVLNDGGERAGYGGPSFFPTLYCLRSLCVVY
jgi:hypothetical protein